ncbi:hypothetical protein E3Q06_03398 [Wallemia mellicola]|nr:hypothetical protein E3Q21_04470 [Wallemia mellicola]TIB85287.1 hypothetical protein E3Q20_03361 [Wallemia mellicola]TIC47013.1 hypothetical protein E3Q06_03398 [Wallemia mellicola]
MAQDYSQLGPPTEAYFVCARKEESDKLPANLGIFCNLKPNQPIHNHNLTPSTTTDVIGICLRYSSMTREKYKWKSLICSSTLNYPICSFIAFVPPY